MLLGCALRRSELAALELTHIQQRDGRWVFVDLVGKGKRIRTVPIPTFAKGHDRRLDGRRWFIGSPLFRRVRRRKYAEKTPAALKRAIWHIVTKYARKPESSTMGGGWTGCADVRQLAAHLRFGLLPGDFSIWLCRNEWDSADSEPKAAEAIFDGAEAAKNRYIEDIPRMKKIVAELDAAIHAASNADAWRRVDKACRLFNARWKSTPTWNFFHKPLKDIQALARDVARQGTVDGELKEGIKAIANGTLASDKAQRELRSLLKEAAVY